MFGGDDDDDFFPSSKSSKLSSLFGTGNSPDGGNASLTYTAPKQPKKSQITDTQKSSDTGASPAVKLNIIIVKPVSTYKLEGENYVSQGKLGAAVLGNLDSRMFQLLLYKGKDQIISSARITPQFQYTVQVNNYATFYNEQKHNWSIMFEGTDDAVEFARHVSLARIIACSCELNQQPLSQDLLVFDGTKANIGDSVEIHYSAYSFQSNILGKEVENSMKHSRSLKIKLNTDDWQENVAGMTKKSKRFIFLPCNLLSIWKGKVSSGSSLVLEVEVVRIRVGSRSSEGSTPIKSSVRDSGGESTLESSTDETSIRARGASISEALSNSPKTNKASIISRMAKMGQATLPLKGPFPCNPSDSEETEEESNISKDNPTSVPKQISKPRNFKSRTHQTAVPTEMPVNNHVYSTPVLPQMSVYPGMAVPIQGVPQASQMTPVQYSGLDGQILPVIPHNMMSTSQIYPTSVVTTPSAPSPDTHLAFYLSETRVQNAEMRMGMTRITEKVDQVLSKLDNLQLQQTNMPAHAARLGALDPSVLLSSIQKLVSDNEHLQTEVSEKQAKLDQQNEKIYELITTNQKYLEKSTSLIEQRNDGALQSMLITLQQDKAKLLSDLEESTSKLSLLQSQLKSNGDLNEKVKSLSSCLESQLTVLEEKKQSVQKLEEALKDSINSRKLLEDNLEKLHTNINQLEENKNKAEHQLNEIKQHLEKQKIQSEQQIEDLKIKHKAELEELQNKLRNETEKSTSSVKNTFEESKEHVIKKLEEEISTRYEPIVKRLENENEHLKKEVSVLQKVNRNDSNNVGDTHAIVTEEVKKVMNVVYRTLQGYFQIGESYEGSKIRENLVSTIRSVTLQLLENERAGPESISPSRNSLSSKPLNVDTKSFVRSGPSVESVSNEENKIAETVHKNENNKNSSGSKTGKSEDIISKPLIDVPKQEIIDTSIHNKHIIISEELETKHIEEKVEKLIGEDHTKENIADSDIKQSDPSLEPAINNPRNVSPERSWKPQPPPPPLFDDEDDDDDWLS